MVNRISKNEQYSYLYLVIATGLVLFLISGLWFYAYNDESDPQFGTVFAGRLYYNSMLAILAVTVVFFYRQSLFALMNYKLLALLLFVFYLSILVSVAPKESLMFCIRLTLLICFFALVATILNQQKLMRILLILFTAATIANLLYVVLMPKYGMMGGIHTGAWRGMFSHKNQFGYYCAFALVFFLQQILLSRTLMRKSAAILLTLINFIFIVKAQSSGSISAAAVGIGASCIILYSPRIPATLKITILLTATLLIIAIIPFFDAISAGILELLGRDPTLTNRTDVWDMYLVEYARSPFLGLGANAYLFDTAMQERLMAKFNMDQAPTPHNGYIVILLQIGAIGMIAYLAVALRIVFTGIKKSITGDGTPLQKLFLAFMLMHLVRGLVETGGSIQLTVYCAYIVMAYVYFHPPKQMAVPEPSIPLAEES